MCPRCSREGVHSRIAQSRHSRFLQIAIIGVDEVTREARGNGFRFSIRFRAGDPAAIEVPYENFTEVSGCDKQQSRKLFLKPYRRTLNSEERRVTVN